MPLLGSNQLPLRPERASGCSLGVLDSGHELVDCARDAAHRLRVPSTETQPPELSAVARVFSGPAHNVAGAGPLTQTGVYPQVSELQHQLITTKHADKLLI